MKINIRSIIRTVFFFISVILCIQTSFASVNENTSCKETILQLKNLEQSSFPERLSTIEGVNELLKTAKDDAYLLSMPLLTSAILSDKEHYQKVLHDMTHAMQKNPPEKNQYSFYAWLYGRVLLASLHIDDGETIANTQKQLKTLLQNENTAKDRFSAWALGYLATLNTHEYSRLRMDMREAGDLLTTYYFEIRDDKKSHTDKIQEARSDALWAWVMFLQAAAIYDDYAFYQYSLEQMKRISNESQVSLALAKGLLRTSASNDYPAWAMAMTRLAAVTIADQTLYAELEKPLLKSIDDAKLAQAKAEVILAQVNNQLAMDRYQLLLSCSKS